ncbi:phosphonate ABC transporter, inner membrane subunit [Thermincola ferriacetica]|uniref:Phosphonate ABC transporter, inner membrane subunit n=1 Tax=Thermincola ferriacetica TaxID=281456 RepID=A0A0L6VYL1_9FIRM|nr:phosphonate ABC transporter, inner membrane subunit [Thermincola ferriacetica]
MTGRRKIGFVEGERILFPENRLSQQRKISYLNLFLILLFLFLFTWSAKATRFNPAAFTDPANLTGIGRFVSGLWPIEHSPEFLKNTGILLVETIEISVVGTVLAVVFAIPLTLGATRLRGEEFSRSSRGTLYWLGRWSVYYGSRFILNLCRGIPELLWALIFVVAVGLGPFPGVLALAAHSTGVLGKLYAEILESVDQRLVETGRATGASELAILLFVKIPASLPVLLSYTLFRWECNMRAATVLGFVGAGGIGTQLTISMQLFAYDEVSTLVLAILGLIFLVDIVGQVIRTRILDHSVRCNSDLLS